MFHHSKQKENSDTENKDSIIENNEKKQGDEGIEEKKSETKEGKEEDIKKEDENKLGNEEQIKKEDENKQ